MKQKLKDNLQLIIALAAVFSLAFGATAYFAKASDVDQIAVRLEQKIKADKIYYLKQQLWNLYKTHRTKDCMQMPSPDDGICNDIKHQLQTLGVKT